MRSAGLAGAKTRPKSSLQGIRYLNTNLFCPCVRSLISENSVSAYLRFQLTSAYFPRWKWKLSAQRGGHSPYILGEQRILWICSQLWKLSKMETCITSIKGRNSFFIQSSMARADLNLCRVLSSVFFSLAAAELLTTLRQAARKTLFVALTAVLKGLVTHSRYSLSYSSTFTTATSVCMCLSKAYDHFPPALSPEKSRDSSTTFAKRRPTLGSLSANAWLLTETSQLFSGTLSQ